jgi:hypothetical protein
MALSPFTYWFTPCPYPAYLSYICTTFFHS